MILAKGLQVNVHGTDHDLALVSDRAKIERVFQNVFNNAVKFTAHGEINVKVQATADKSGVEFEIIDTGVGIEESKIDSIFEPFHQADTSVQRAYSGLGLGLTVARRMAELVGGKLSVSSKAGSGTRVTMTFPSQANATTPLAADQRKYG
jgi:signal transduction histidine kinase